MQETAYDQAAEPAEPDGPKFVRMFTVPHGDTSTIYAIAPDRKVFSECCGEWFDTGVTSDTMLRNPHAVEIPIPPEYAIEPPTASGSGRRRTNRP